MRGFDHRPGPRLVFGPGAVEGLGEPAREMGFRRSLLVCDRGLVEAGHFDRCAAALRRAGLGVAPFHDFAENPDSAMAERGAALARAEGVDSLVALGGGSSLDCAKGLNFLLTGGGVMADYRGWGKAARPLLPMIGVPTTAGTGSEAQSYCLISDPRTHEKMACGDPGAAFRLAVLDPTLTVSQPAVVTAVAGYDAVSHAVESCVSTAATPVSDMYAREAFRLLEGCYERVLAHPADLEARGAMLLGSHLAGLAIEASMLGAAHACANPLSARHGTTHGVAIALLLPHVVRWNASFAGRRYGGLLAAAGRTAGPGGAAEALARRLEELARAGGLPRRLSEAEVGLDHLPELAAQAAEQWTGRFNPRPFDAAGALEVYRCAW